MQKIPDQEFSKTFNHIPAMKESGLESWPSRLVSGEIVCGDDHAL
jgi:hypothetical protein